MRIKKKKTFIFILSLVFITVSSITVFSVEYLEPNNPNVKLRWTVVSNSKYTTRVHNMLPSSHPSFYSITTGVNRVNSQSPSNIQCLVTTFDTSNVDVMQFSSDTWDAHMYNGNAIAVAVPRNESGFYYYTTDQFPSSGTIFINYAQIGYNPGGSILSNDEWISTIMHELLHVYGMGHAYLLGTNSVTNNITNDNLTSYDIDEFERMYP